ncbi:MAG: CBM9 family sugar-binding protein, partial [Gammaproteobacteria bacterium]|nr:CBM9 family sugar-binding protein [Gammaproteobacteria bacterium]
MHTKTRFAHLLITASLAIATTTACADSAHYADRTEYRAPKAKVAPIIDGVADEAIWQQARWQELKQRWLGPEYTAEDFQGRYKVVWTADKIYILGEFTDD